MKDLKTCLAIATLLISVNYATAQDDNKIKFSGELLTDQRFLLESPYDWAWNENRLTLKVSKKITDNSKFYSEVWLRNIGVPQASTTADLYNKGIIDPYNLEIREAYVQIYGFLSPNLDVNIGRQRITWGTADKLNPTDNLNPYDLEDVLDFGRHRGSDALSMDYYFNTEFSLQGVYIPFFQPANLPVGVFATALSPALELPPPLALKGVDDEIILPRYNLAESSIAGLKFKGFLAGYDFSLSYVWGRDGLPISTYNSFIPVDTLGGVSINSELSFYRTHIFGADLAGSIGGVGIWAEGGAFLPENEVLMTNDFSGFFPPGMDPLSQDSVVLKKEVYTKFVVGADYIFTNGIYINVQYMHGFVNERGRDALNDYFFVQMDKKFFDDRLKISPLAGGFIVSDWQDVQNNFALIYVPNVSYMATDNIEMTISAAIFDGKGDNNIFANFNDYNMMMFKMKYSF